MNDSIVITALVGLVCALLGFLFKTLLSDRDKRIEALEDENEKRSDERVEFAVLKQKVEQYISMLEKIDKKTDEIISNKGENNEKDC